MKLEEALLKIYTEILDACQPYKDVEVPYNILYSAEEWGWNDTEVRDMLMLFAKSQVEGNS